MKFCTNIHGSLMMYLFEFDDPLNLLESSFNIWNEISRKLLNGFTDLEVSDLSSILVFGLVISKKNE